MKKFNVLAATSVVSSLVLFGSVYAFEVNTTFDAQARARGDDGEVKVYSSSSVRASSTSDREDGDDKDEISATGSRERMENDDEDEDRDARVRASSTATSSREKNEVGEEHRSIVATFVHSLLNVADREWGIGEQVRVIARAQSSSSASTSEAIAKVESKDKLAIFLFGNDYKSLNKIRNEIKKTEKRITDLENMIASTSTVLLDSDKVELQSQLAILKTNEVNLEGYVTAHEDQFSVFGWFTRLFVKAE